MVTYHRPEQVTALVYAPREYYYHRPQMIVVMASGPSPGIDTELVEETLGVIDTLVYDQGTDAGFVLVQESS